jgi:hypothetical protein
MALAAVLALVVQAASLAVILAYDVSGGRGLEHPASRGPVALVVDRYSICQSGDNQGYNPDDGDFLHGDYSSFFSDPISQGGHSCALGLLTYYEKSQPGFF